MPTAVGTTEIPSRRGDDQGFSMIVTLISLVAVALLTLFAFKATFGPSGSSPASGGVSQPVAEADGTQAQQALSTGLGAVATASGGSGSYLGIDAAELSASEPSVQFTGGPSTGPASVSVAATGDGSGAVTLAVRAVDGTCWFAWRAPDSGAWYGARTGGATCAAQPVEPTPDPGPVSSASVGWEQGSFPSV